MKGRSGTVGDVTRTYRTGLIPNPSGMPIAAWKSSKSSNGHVASISADIFFGRNDVSKSNSVAIDVSAVTTAHKFEDDRNHFHDAIRPILLVAQCFAVLPVSGIRYADSSHLTFTWKSPKIIYYIISFFGAGVLMICSIARVLVTGITATKATNVVFFGSACITMLLFLRLATRWPKFIRAWEKVEGEMTSPPPTTSRMRLKHRLALMTGITMSLAVVEHLMSVYSGYASALECAYLRGDTDIVATYFQSQFPQVFHLTGYSLWKGMLVQCVNILSTFSWNFMDLFLMLLGSALTERFRQMNDRLYSVRGKEMPDWWWSEAREDYNRLANLTRRVDQCVSDIVLLSFANNLYFICIQLLNSLKYITIIAMPRRGIPHSIYSSFSFAFLIARTVAVSLYAAAVNDQSLRPSPVLYSVSTTSYSTEVQRFLIQATTDRIGLTGLNFFAVTRSLILTVAGTIVTYELVLVQFNGMQSVDAAVFNITNACEVK